MSGNNYDNNYAPVHHETTSGTGQSISSSGYTGDADVAGTNLGFGNERDYNSTRQQGYTGDAGLAGTNTNTGFGNDREYSSGRQTGYTDDAGLTGTRIGFGSDREYGSTQPMGMTNTTSGLSSQDMNYSNRDTIGTSTDRDDTFRSSEYRQAPLELSHEHAPRREIDQSQDALASTQGPFKVPTTDDVSGSDVPPTSSVGNQNLPGARGERGEMILGAAGVGGSQVERPKEDQGIGEKIVNFLGI